MLASAARSSVPRAEWARRRGIDARSLNMWRLNLSRSASTPRLRLVELVAEAVPADAEPVLVQCGRFTVAVRPGVDETLLRSVLGAVAAC